jgi:hypothetical protein
MRRASRILGALIPPPTVTESNQAKDAAMPPTSLNEFCQKYARQRARHGVLLRLSSRPLIRVPNDYVRSALPQTLAVAGAIAPDAVRRPGPAAPVSSELSLTRHAAVFTVDCRRARRPRQAAGALRMLNGAGGRLSSKHKQATLAVHLAPDRPPSPLGSALTQTAGAAAHVIFRSSTRACARASGAGTGRSQPSGRDCSLRAVIEVPSSIC